MKGKKVEAEGKVTGKVAEIAVYLLKIIIVNTLLFEYMSNLELINCFRESIKFMIKKKVSEKLLYK